MFVGELRDEDDEENDSGEKIPLKTPWKSSVNTSI